MLNPATTAATTVVHRGGAQVVRKTFRTYYFKTSLFGQTFNFHLNPYFSIIRTAISTVTTLYNDLLMYRASLALALIS